MSAHFSRSHLEAQLFMDLNPCECGESDFDRNHSHGRGVAGWQVEYSGTCAGCGRARVVVFQVDRKMPVLPPGAWSDGRTPSRIIDPGEWLIVADQLSDHTADLLDLDREQAHRRLNDFAYAASAVAEALLFIRPGQDAVPAASIRSARGRELYGVDPERFTRAALEKARDLYQALGGEIEPRFTNRPLHARSVGEASLFMELHRCECGENAFERTARRVPDTADRDMLLYEGICESCGEQRGFLFSVPKAARGEPVSTPMGLGFSRPSDGPSAIVDPGMWRVAGYRYAATRDAVADANAGGWDDIEKWREMIDVLAGAVAIVDELLRFVPPGVDRIPAEALRTGTSRTLYRGEPDLFARARLVRERAERERDLADFIARHPEPADE